MAWITAGLPFSDWHSALRLWSSWGRLVRRCSCRVPSSCGDIVLVAEIQCGPGLLIIPPHCGAWVSLGLDPLDLQPHLVRDSHTWAWVLLLPGASGARRRTSECLQSGQNWEVRSSLAVTGSGSCTDRGEAAAPCHAQWEAVISNVRRLRADPARCSRRAAALGTRTPA